MIIKGLFRRHGRWNPVHPTSGIFWGMGIGFGCGIGWGPGFGSEVIGNVGAGCGVGFSVGITLAGFGIGLPANYLIQVPFDGLIATKNSTLKLARSGGAARNFVGDGWNNISSSISGMERDVSARLSSIIFNLRSTVLKCINDCGSSLWRPHKGDS